MLAINLDSKGFLHLRPYNPKLFNIYGDKVSEFITQAEQPYNYRVFKSKSLTNAFLAKYGLEKLVYQMLLGYTFVLPAFNGFNDADIISLRRYRYSNIKQLRTDYSASNLPDLSQAQPVKVLVYDGLLTVSLSVWLKHKQQIKLDSVLKQFSREIVLRTDTAIYFKSDLYQPSALWKSQFLRAGYSIECFTLDSILGKIVLTPVVTNSLH